MADTKLTALTALEETPAIDDVIYIADISAGTAGSRKIEAVWFLRTDGSVALLEGGGTVHLGGYSLTAAADGTVVTTDGVQTLTNKTIGTIAITDGTITDTDFVGVDAFSFAWGTSYVTGGTLTANRSRVNVYGEGTTTTDDIDTILPAVTGKLLAIQPISGHTITLKHGTGNLALPNSKDIILDSYDDAIMLFKRAVSGNWGVVNGPLFMHSGGSIDAYSIGTITSVGGTLDNMAIGTPTITGGTITGATIENMVGEASMTDGSATFSMQSIAIVANGSVGILDAASISKRLRYEVIGQDASGDIFTAAGVVNYSTASALYDQVDQDVNSYFRLYVGTAGDVYAYGTATYLTEAGTAHFTLFYV